MARRPSMGGRWTAEQAREANARYVALDDADSVTPAELVEAITLMRELHVEQSNQAREKGDVLATARLDSAAMAYERCLALAEKMKAALEPDAAPAGPKGP